MDAYVELHWAVLALICLGCWAVGAIQGLARGKECW